MSEVAVHPFIRFALACLIASVFSGCVTPYKPSFPSLEAVNCVATEMHPLKKKSDKAPEPEVVQLKRQLSLSSEPVEGDYLIGLSKKTGVRYLVGVERTRLNMGVRHHSGDAAIARSFDEMTDQMSISLEHPPASGDIYEIVCRPNPKFTPALDAAK